MVATPDVAIRNPSRRRDGQTKSAHLAPVSDLLDLLWSIDVLLRAKPFERVLSDIGAPSVPRLSLSRLLQLAREREGVREYFL